MANNKHNKKKNPPVITRSKFSDEEETHEKGHINVNNSNETFDNIPHISRPKEPVNFYNPTDLTEHKLVETPTTNQPPAISEYQARQQKLEARRQQLEAERDANNVPVEDKNGRWKSGLKGALQGLADSFSMKHGLVSDWNEFFARAGAGIGGFAGGMINPKSDEEFQQLKNKGLIENKFKTLNQEEDQFYNSSLRDAQIRYQNERPAIEQAKLDSREKIAEQKLQSVIEREQRKALAEGNKFSLQWEDGILKRIYKDPTRNAETVIDDDGMPVTRRTEVPINVNGFDVRGRDGLAAQTASKDDQQSVAERNRRRKEDYNQRESKIKGLLNGSKAQLATINSQIQSIQGKINSNTAYDSDYQQLNALQKSHADLTGKIEQYQSELNNMIPPTDEISIPPPVISRGGKYSGMMFSTPDSLRQFFPNFTDEQIRNLVLSQGGQFQN